MNKKGFTIIEFMIVIGIIGILATIVIGGSHYAKVYANKKKVRADLSEIAKGIDTLALDTRQWPGHQTPYIVCQSSCNDNEIEDLTLPLAGLKATDGLYSNWNGPYMQTLFNDPWGNPYFYDSDYDIGGTGYAVVGSYGPNGQGLNLYDSDDIVQIINR